MNGRPLLNQTVRLDWFSADVGDPDIRTYAQQRIKKTLLAWIYCRINLTGAYFRKQGIKLLKPLVKSVRCMQIPGKALQISEQGTVKP